MMVHMKKFPKSFFALLLFLIAFILLVLGAVLPYVFQETVFINNSYFGGKSYPPSTQVTTGANTIDSNLLNFRNRYKDYIITHSFGIFFFCVKIEVNQYGGKNYGGGYGVQGVTTAGGGPSIPTGINCYHYDWSDLENSYSTSEFDNYMYTEGLENSTVIISEVDASAPGFPGGGTTTQPTKHVYEITGTSVFLQNVNANTFHALQAFIIIALIISFIILVKLVVLAILHCLHHFHGCHKKHIKLLKFLHILFWILKVVWIIILILLLVIYYDIIHFLIIQSVALSIFWIGFAFWFFWVGFILVIIVCTILHFHHKFLKLSLSASHVEMTHMPSGYPVVMSASAPASSPTMAPNSFV